MFYIKQGNQLEMPVNKMFEDVFRGIHLSRPQRQNSTYRDPQIPDNA